MAKIVTGTLGTLQLFDGKEWLDVGEVGDFQWQLNPAAAEHLAHWPPTTPSTISVTLTFSPWLPSAAGRRRRSPLHGGGLPKLRRGERAAPVWLVRRKMAKKGVRLLWA